MPVVVSISEVAYSRKMNLLGQFGFLLAANYAPRPEGQSATAHASMASLLLQSMFLRYPIFERLAFFGWAFHAQVGSLCFLA